MNMNISFSLDTIKKGIVRFLRRFHIVLFVVIVLGGISIVIFILNTVIVRSSVPDGYTSNTNNASFDQVTMKKVDELRTSSQSGSAPALPSGRINPFVE